MTHHRNRGFTLIEIVLVVALIAIISGVGLRLPHLFAPQQMYEADMFAIVTSLYRAQTLAASGRSDDAWGVSVTADDVTVFRGESYDDRDESSDERVIFESDAVPTGATEVVFGKRTGVPDAAATVSMQFDAGEAHVVINEYGVFDYQDDF